MHTQQNFLNRSVTSVCFPFEQNQIPQDRTNLRPSSQETFFTFTDPVEIARIDSQVNSIGPGSDAKFFPLFLLKDDLNIFFHKQ